MPLYHVVLFKFKPDVTEEQIETLTTAAKEMVGQIPGLERVDVGPPLAMTAKRALGYNYSLMAILDKPQSLPVYAQHPAHVKVNDMRMEFTEEVDGTLVYDLVY